MKGQGSCTRCCRCPITGQCLEVAAAHHGTECEVPSSVESCSQARGGVGPAGAAPILMSTQELAAAGVVAVRIVPRGTLRWRRLDRWLLAAGAAGLVAGLACSQARLPFPHTFSAHLRAARARGRGWIVERTNGQAHIPAVWSDTNLSRTS